MKVVILAGGLGSRLAEETESRPKPMVEIGGMPMLWHLMKYFGHFGFKEFVVALGYKGDQIKRFFLEYPVLSQDCTVSLADGKIERRGGSTDDWTVHLIDTGPNTMTGGRLRRLAPMIGSEPFLMTYGDGVANVDLHRLVEFHKKHGKLATVTAVRPPSRFGGLILEGERVLRFEEKPQIGEGWINGGFFVLEPQTLNYIDGDATAWEREPVERLTAEGNLCAFSHDGFWQCMDTIRDKRFLEDLWKENQAPWRVWA